MAARGKRRMGWILLITVGLVLAGWAALSYAIRTNGPAVLDAVDRLTGGSRDVALRHSAQFGSSPHQKIRVFGQEGDTASRPVILFVHGGSWRSGDPDDYRFIARALVPEGFVVVLAGYRLGDQGLFPAMVEDTAAATAWVRAHIGEFGGDPDALILAGHSAGAYNVAMVALDRQWLGREGLAQDSVKGVVGIAGPYDFYPFDSDSTKASFGQAPRPEATQPINFVRGDAPPMLLLTGEKDTTVKPRNTRTLAAAIREADGSAETEFYPAHDHISILTATASPWGRDRALIGRIAGFAHKAVQAEPGPGAQASVPVQAQTR